MKDLIKNILYLLTLILFFLVLFVTIISYYYIKNPNLNIPFLIQFFINYHYFFMFFIAFFGVIFGSITQIMTSKEIEKNNLKFNNLKNIFLKSLSFDEKRIIIHLIENNGIVTQYELTKLENLNKLKVSRLLLIMENKNLLNKKKIGKINKIYLNNKLKEIFL